MKVISKEAERALRKPAVRRLIHPQGAELERRKAARCCLRCCAALTYQFDSDPKTGFLFDLCSNCRQIVAMVTRTELVAASARFLDDQFLQVAAPRRR